MTGGGFVADRSPDAVAKLADKLLASPHFGERWGRHWLHVARYAESTGNASRGVLRVVTTKTPTNSRGSLQEDLAGNCERIDKPIAGLLTDLKQRGLLMDTLVIWVGEFGRTPYAQGTAGRDFRPTDVKGTVANDILA